MGSLLIKDDLLREVTAFANVRSVPVEQQAEDLLLESLVRHANRTQLRKMMEAIAAMTPPGVMQTDSVEIVREARTR
jgi:hypothetical protein